MPDSDLLVQETPFVLDDRSLQTRLEDIQRYVRKMPFTGEEQAPNEHPATDPQANAQFGYAVSISADGSTMAVGAPFYQQENEDPNGAVYLFNRAGADWQPTQQLVIPGSGSQFGFALSLDREGRTLVVGAPLGQGNEPEAGAVYVYTREVRDWDGEPNTREVAEWGIGQQLPVSTNSSSDQFGRTVSVSGDGLTIAVGAPKRYATPASNAGAVYIYHRKDSKWSNTKRLIRWPSVNGNSEFGFSVALNDQGTAVAVGTRVDTGTYRGAITVFRYEGGDWDATPPLFMSDFPNRSHFGYSISLSGDGNTLVFSSLDMRKVRTYRYAGDTWSPLPELTGPTADDAFGASVSLSADGHVLAIGAPGSSTVAGTVYLYRRSGDAWVDRKEVRIGSSSAGAAFGHSVSLNEDGSRLVAGAPLHDLTGGEIKAGVVHTLDIASFWSDVHFTTGDQPARLAQRYANPDEADGAMRPHQAFLLGFMRMLETPRDMLNTLPAAHRQLYYRDLLGLKERPIVPDQVAVGFTLAEGTPELLLPAGTLLDGGQDSEGAPKHYRLAQALLANQGQFTDLRWQAPVQGDSDAQITRIVYDRDHGVPWPQGGVQLFAPAPDVEQDKPLVTGRVISSPVLSMSGGKRIVSVRFSVGIGDILNGITAELSSTGAWLPLTKSDSGTAYIDFELSADAGAVTPPQGLDGFHDEMPLLKLTHSGGLPVPRVLRLGVGVKKAPDVLYSTDEGEAALDGVSYPFRSEPVIGAGINLVCADWCAKPYVTTVTVTPIWADLPTTSFREWYTYYPDLPENNADFKVQALMVTRGGRTPSGDQISLFQSGADKPIGEAISFSFTNLPAVVADSGDPKDWQAWLRLELVDKDFLHKHYGQALQTNPGANPPYTPQFVGLQVDYSIAETPEGLTQYVLTPFGHLAESVAALGTSEPGMILADDLEAAAANFGYALSVSADGGTLAVGAPYRTDAQEKQSGAVYLFSRGEAGWVQQQKLEAPESASGGLFGFSISLDNMGTTLAVGAPEASGGGTAYAYRRTTTQWGDAVELTSDRSAQGKYGYAVSTSGDGLTVAIGAPYFHSTVGMVAMFGWEEEAWKARGVWIAGSGRLSDVPQDACFGYSLSLNDDGTMLAGGAPGYKSAEGVASGAVFVFRRSANSWDVAPSYTISDPTAPRQLGGAVNLSADGNVLAIGELKAEPDAISTVYLLRRNGNQWSGWEQFTTNVPGDRFGACLSQSRDVRTLAVGAPGAEQGKGRAFLFHGNGATWQKESTRFRVAGVQGYGSAVALDADGRKLIAGAPLYDTSTKLGVGAVLDVDTNDAVFYLGFSALQPGQDINLHWQLQSPQPLKLDWQYLNHRNQWRPLDAQVRDDTGGLFESGLWHCTLPPDAASHAAQMPPGRHWIRATAWPTSPSVMESDDAASDYPRLLGVQANAALAVLVDGDLLEAAHFEQALPAYTITNTVQALEGLAQVEQPWPSFGGRGPEQEAEFLQRAAQRLENRGRVLAWRDVRSLLREHFPEIHDVRVPSSQASSQAQQVERPARNAPRRQTLGAQQLVVIPANGHMDNNDPLRPILNPARLARMHTYLQSVASPWMQLTPINPEYIPVMVKYEIDFTVGTNDDYGRRQLRLALERRYMPWSWDGRSTVSLGDRIDYYGMVAFIQAQPWVERVRSLTLRGEPTSVEGADTEVLILVWPDEASVGAPPAILPILSNTQKRSA